MDDKPQVSEGCWQEHTIKALNGCNSARSRWTHRVSFPLCMLEQADQHPMVSRKQEETAPEREGVETQRIGIGQPYWLKVRAHPSDGGYATEGGKVGSSWVLRWMGLSPS